VGVDDRRHRVQARLVAEAAPVLTREREGLGDVERLRDAGRLDQQVVEGAFAREPGDLDEQVLAQRAADAAVRQLDEPLLDARERAGAAAHELRVDVDLAHVVDDHGDPQAVAVGQQVVEHGGLARAEESGQDGDGQPGVAGRGGVVGHGADASMK
jgi:hypothetical protein